MRGIDAAKPRCLGSKRYELVGLGVRCGRVFKRGRNSYRPVFHGLSHQGFHLYELLRRWLLVVVTEHHAADLCRAYIARQIDAHSLFFQPGKILTEGPPVGIDVVVLIARLIGANDCVIERSGTSPLAGNLSGDSLIDFRRQARVHQDGHLRLSQHVDKAGSDNLALGINGTSTRIRGQIADGCYRSAANADVAGIPGRSGSIDNVAIRDDEVKGSVGDLREKIGKAKREKDSDDQIIREYSRSIAVHRWREL